MRGLAVVTNNSTYLFDTDQVMWVSHDQSTEKHLGGGAYLISGQWYTVTRKPSEPYYDSLDFGTGNCNYKGITFGFSAWNQDPTLVTTSRIREWAYLGDGDAEGVFLTHDDKLQIVRDLVVKNADSLELRDGFIGARIRTIALVRAEFPSMGLIEARELVSEVASGIRVTTAVTFDNGHLTGEYDPTLRIEAEQY